MRFLIHLLHFDFQRKTALLLLLLLLLMMFLLLILCFKDDCFKHILIFLWHPQLFDILPIRNPLISQNLICLNIYFNEIKVMFKQNKLKFGRSYNFTLIHNVLHVNTKLNNGYFCFAYLFIFSPWFHTNIYDLKQSSNTMIKLMNINCKI